MAVATLDNRTILTEAEVCSLLGIKDIAGVYDYIYNNYTPERFLNWVFLEIVNSNNVDNYNATFNDFYLYKVELTLKIPPPEKEQYFILKQRDIEVLRDKYYKIKTRDLNFMWHNYFIENNLKVRSKLPFIADIDLQNRTHDFIEKVYQKCQNEGRAQRVTVTTLLNYLFEGPAKYGKMPLVKKILKDMGFVLRNPDVSSSYFIVSQFTIKGINRRGGK